MITAAYIYIYTHVNPLIMDGRDIIAVRDTQLGPNISVFYKDRGGLVAVRGEGCYLIDDSGNRHLDTCNNVACVGHSHPNVVKAGQEALSQIQTNQRFLHPGQQRYLAKLLKTFPPELNTVYLVNSGSEANDLALRMAREHTTACNPNDVIVLNNAYHGNTAATIEISPYKWSQATDGRNYKKPHVHVVSMPATSSSPLLDHSNSARCDPSASSMRWRSMGYTEESGAQYSAEVESIVSRTGGVGVFIAESAMGCGGQMLLPPSYLQRCYRAVRDTGGVCIADEVQTGFSRSGTHFWMFEMHGVVPDIVTLGKPMGNGYPISAVVCRRDVAESFAKTGIEYFNTFGGNSVACAIAEAVLDTILTEGLQDHANRVGVYLKDKLLNLKAKYPFFVGDVRGCGLFQGIEFVKHLSVDQQSVQCGQSFPEECPEMAKFVVDFLQENQIIASRDANVIKIKPPLVIGLHEIDSLIGGIEKGIIEWGIRKGMSLEQEVK